jgi:hypothetical protein
MNVIRQKPPPVTFSSLPNESLQDILPRHDQGWAMLLSLTAFGLADDLWKLKW